MESSAKPGFDILVTKRDEHSGLIVGKNPYTLRILGQEDGSKVKLWERPVGSGNLWNFKGEPIGRWVNNEWKKDAKHVAFTPPETQDQKLARAMIEKDAKIASMEAELAAIKAEQDKKAQAKPAAATKNETGA